MRVTPAVSVSILALIIGVCIINAAPAPTQTKPAPTATAMQQRTATSTPVARTSGSTATSTSAPVVMKAGNKRVQGQQRPVSGGRTVTDNVNEQCYKICDTCVCDVGEQLNCCTDELPQSFKGCAVINALQLCSTNRPVNACCR